jgi:hypothetical protein
MARSRFDGFSDCLWVVSKETTFATNADRPVGQAIPQVAVSQKFVSE